MSQRSPLGSTSSEHVVQYRRENADRGLARAKAALVAMGEAFTPQEAKAYGEYRSGVLAEIAAMKA